MKYTKRLFLLLVVLNLATFLWLYPQRLQQERAAQTHEPEIGQLRLLSEIADFDRAGPASAPAPEPEPARELEAPQSAWVPPVQAPQVEPIMPTEQAQLAETAPKDAPELAAESPQEPVQQPEHEQGLLEVATTEITAPTEPQPQPLSETETAKATAEPVLEQPVLELEPSAAGVASREPPPTVPATESIAEATAVSPETAPAQTPETAPAPDMTPAAAQPEVPSTPSTAQVELIACYRLGPIERRPEAEKLAARLAPLALEADIREETVQKDAGYWVVHPPLPTTELAEAKEREFKAAGIHDIWRMREGDLKGAISLGLFFEKKNAEKLKRQLEAKGFKPEIRMRQTVQQVHWVGLRLRGDAASLARIEEALSKRRPVLAPQPIPCPDVVSP